MGSSKAFHHHKPILPKCVIVIITSPLVVDFLLPYLDKEHDPPLQTIGDAIGYNIVLWPWKLTELDME
jgi:hypothetical protein